MKKIFLFLISAFVLVFVSGCLVRSLHPLYTEKDVIFDESLVGIWKQDDDKTTWQFEKSGNKSYKLIHTDNKGNKAEFELYLVKLGSRKFLDIYLTSIGNDVNKKVNNFSLFHLWPVHTFMRVDAIGAKIQLSYFDLEWLSKKLKDNPKALSHIRKGEDILLTATPEELQDFILQNVDVAFSDSLTLKKLTKYKKTVQNKIQNDNLFFKLSGSDILFFTTGQE